MLDLSKLEFDIRAVESEARRDGVILFGAGGFARAVQNALASLGIRVHAFIVSSSTTREVAGIPVVDLAEVGSVGVSAPVWVAIFNRNKDSDYRDLAQACISHGLGAPRFPMDYFELIESQMGWRFWLTDRRNYRAVLPRIEAVIQALGDAESRDQLAQTIRFRIGAGAAVPPTPSGERQYFPGHIVEALNAVHRPLVYVDGGAYDGDTVREAFQQLSIARAYAFEPDPRNFARLANAASGMPFPVSCVPCGLSDHTQMLSFVDQAGEAGTLRPDGSIRVQCVRLDECVVGESVDYLKLDVEGHELAALEGSRGLKHAERTAFAIAGYHRWDDLWMIPEFFASNFPRHRLTYRTHESNSFDSVFYAVP